MFFCIPSYKRNDSNKKSLFFISTWLCERRRLKKLDRVHNRILPYVPVAAASINFNSSEKEDKGIVDEKN